MTPKLRSNMTATDRQKLEPPDRHRGRAHATAAIRADEVPDVITRGLRERDGAVGRAVLVYPNPAESWWRGETIATFVKTLREVAQAPVALGGRAGARGRRPRALVRHHLVDANATARSPHCWRSWASS